MARKTERGPVVEWAQLACHHWLLSNTLQDLSSRGAKDEAGRKELRKDARLHRQIAEQLGDIAAEEAISLIKAYRASPGAEEQEEEEEEEEQEGEPVEQLTAEEEGESLGLPARRPR